MNGFKPVKSRANNFKYKPRFYDPQKEARDKRREELLGKRPVGEEEGDYVPGEYLHRQSEARERRRTAQESRGNSIIYLVMIAAVVLLLAYLVVPRIVDAFMTSGTTPAKVKPVNEYEEFDPYAPIRIVPNDYEGE